MNAETEKTGVRRDSTVAHLVALATTGRGEDVKARSSRPAPTCVGFFAFLALLSVGLAYFG